MFDEKEKKKKTVQHKLSRKKEDLIERK